MHPAVAQKIEGCTAHVENKPHEREAFGQRAHKEDKIIGLLVSDLERRVNLAILGACQVSDKRQGYD